MIIGHANQNSGLKVEAPKYKLQKACVKYSSVKIYTFLIKVFQANQTPIATKIAVQETRWSFFIDQLFLSISNVHNTLFLAKFLALDLIE